MPSTAEDDEAKISKSWKRLHATLAALRGDDKTEAFLSEKHPELLSIISPKGGPRPLPVDDSAVKQWFDRKLAGHRDGPKERILLCDRVAQKVRHRAGGWKLTEPEKIAEALHQNSAEEGPMVCSALLKELDGSRFEGVWLSREGPGIYRIGDEPQTRVAVQVLDGKLLIHGYFEGENLHPVRMSVKAFLEQHGPKDMRAAADEDCDLFGGGAAKAQERGRSRSPRQKASTAGSEPPLPPGWEKKESRSKPGVFYYANEAKGLTQFDRPK
eukprot:TRINITY_DN73151_c0_g1_i1.p1 TRINITY_DN73151_c0_g1~~TRINITY_DN73151_c0_g1_i1.p1  ORF type:complete len:270 (-),score=62.38 TRINITY_DN73151_c0_g1_i1:290-1099(-)